MLFLAASAGLGCAGGTGEFDPLAGCGYLRVPELPFEVVGMHGAGQTDSFICLINGASMSEQAAISIVRYETVEAAQSFVDDHPDGDAADSTFDTDAAMMVMADEDRVIIVQVQTPSGDDEGIALAIAERAADDD